MELLSGQAGGQASGQRGRWSPGSQGGPAPASGSPRKAPTVLLDALKGMAWVTALPFHEGLAQAVGIAIRLTAALIACVVCGTGRGGGERTISTRPRRVGTLACAARSAPGPGCPGLPCLCPYSPHFIPGNFPDWLVLGEGRGWARVEWALGVSPRRPHTHLPLSSSVSDREARSLNCKRKVWSGVPLMTPAGGRAEVLGQGTAAGSLGGGMASRASGRPAASARPPTHPLPTDSRRLQ